MTTINILNTLTHHNEHTTRIIETLGSVMELKGSYLAFPVEDQDNKVYVQSNLTGKELEVVCLFTATGHLVLFCTDGDGYYEMFSPTLKGQAFSDLPNHIRDAVEEELMADTEVNVDLLQSYMVSRRIKI